MWVVSSRSGFYGLGKAGIDFFRKNEWATYLYTHTPWVDLPPPSPCWRKHTEHPYLGADARQSLVDHSQNIIVSTVRLWRENQSIVVR